MILKKSDEDLNLVFMFKRDDSYYSVHVTSDTLKCFECGTVGHVIGSRPVIAGTVVQYPEPHELYSALESLEIGKAPGIDGLPLDFNKVFWPGIGKDLLLVLRDSLSTKLFTLSCRRAILALLLSWGDFQEIKNRQPVARLGSALTTNLCQRCKPRAQETFMLTRLTVYTQ